jgi:hypothetical protein
MNILTADGKDRAVLLKALMNVLNTMVLAVTANIALLIYRRLKMAKYKISARVDGVMKTHIVDALDKDDAAQYGFCMWDVEDVFVEEVEK